MREAWILTLTQIPKNKSEGRTVISQSDPLKSTLALKQELSKFTVASMPFFAEFKLRCVSLTREEQVTQIKAVNVKMETITTIFADLAIRVTEDPSLLPSGDPVTITMIRLMQNFSIIIGFRSYSNTEAPVLLREVQDYFRRYNQPTIMFEVSVTPRITRSIHIGGISVKNTFDSASTANEKL